MITWKVNGEVKASYYQEILGDKERNFMPYFEMYYPGDII
jgi:hypothetical protein